MINKPQNENYCATVVKISSIIPLDNCDNVVHANILGNLIVVSKDTKENDVGLFFPVETQLSDEYARVNNLFRHSENNLDNTKKGYFEDNRRVRCVKFRGNKSEGLFMPLKSLEPIITEFTEESIESLNELKVGDDFDMLFDIPICNKYTIKKKNSGSSNKKSKKPKESKIIDNQFRFHIDTNQLYKHLNEIYPENYISITYKMHGTSGISSKVLCKKKLTIWNKIGKLLGFDIVNKEYDYIYSSRKVIKNPDLNPNANHFYSDDIWGIADSNLRDVISNGITLYYEIVGYLPNGSMIQKDYDYGYERTINDNYKEGINYGIYIYRITYTNDEGKVFEFSFPQIMEWCKSYGLKHVPLLYYGMVKNFTEIIPGKYDKTSDLFIEDLEEWRIYFLESIKNQYNEKNCYMCKSTVPEEGCVIRIESLDFKAYKQKSNSFYERETKMLDKEIEDIESSQN